jgi:hypothetical protein
MSPFKKKKLDFLTEPPRLLFQQDYYSIAWGLKHQGYYISSEGIKYSYNNPIKWNFYEKLRIDGTKEMSWGHDKISFIEKGKLLKNLVECEMKYTDNKIETDSIFSVIDELIKSDLIETRFGGCDMGLQSTSLLIYDDLNNNYKRILLECQGDFFLELNSEKKSFIYEKFK